MTHSQSHTTHSKASGANINPNSLNAAICLKYTALNARSANPTKGDQLARQQAVTVHTDIINNLFTSTQSRHNIT